MIGLLLAILAHQGLAWDNSTHPWIVGVDVVVYHHATDAWQRGQYDWEDEAGWHRTLRLHPHRWLDLPAGEVVTACVAWIYIHPDAPGVPELTGPSCINYEWPELCDVGTGEVCPWPGDRVRPPLAPVDPE